MFDLNISWSPATSPQDLERTLSHAANLGYKTVALNNIISTPIPQHIKNPLPVFPPHDTTATTATNTNPPTTTTSNLPTILHRATIILTEPSQNHRLLSLAPHYHILALRPTNDKSFAAACLTIPDIPLISLDLSHRLPFRLRAKHCAVAVARGLRFEISYAQLLSASSSASGSGGGGMDSRARANFIGNVMTLVRATRGKGIVLSSGAGKPLDLRAPMDVVNLLSVWGLASERGVEAIGAGPRSVVVNEGARRRGYRGVVEVVKVAPAPAGEDKGDQDKEDSGRKGEDAAGGGGKGKKGQKRKNHVDNPAGGLRPGKKSKNGEKAA